MHKTFPDHHRRSADGASREAFASREEAVVSDLLERSMLESVRLSGVQEQRVLLVDDMCGIVERHVPGSGGDVRLVVRTGSWRSMWQASDVENGAVSVNATWTSSGGDGGVLELTVPPNISGGVRTFSLLVRRLSGDGSVDPDTPAVTLRVVQPKSEHLLVVTPGCRRGAVVIEGFDPSLATARSGISVRRKFSVTLADPSRYTYSVRSSFHKDWDAFLTPHAPAGNGVVAGWMPNMTLQDSLYGLRNGEAFYLNVFRTGPGDPTINGTLTVTAVPNNPHVGETQSIVLDVSIRTSCVVGDVLIPRPDGDWMLVADRNVGAAPRVQDGCFVSARNFSNDRRMLITGSGQGDNTYNEWKGDYFPWTASDREACLGVGDPGFVARHWLYPDEGQGSNVDDGGVFSPWYRRRDIRLWRVPDCAEMLEISRRLVYSKGRVFLVSATRDRESGGSVGCWFPLSGLDSNPANVYGYYWSGTAFSGGSYNAYVLSLAPPGSMLSFGSKRYMYSVRCVRSVTPDELSAAGIDPGAGSGDLPGGD